ncbi:MAG: hypothetical protein Q9211_005740 [Gyalolechia sp. 1 TL-2023]
MPPVYRQPGPTGNNPGSQQLAASNNIVGFQELAAVNNILGYQRPVPLSNTQSLSRKFPPTTTSTSAVSRSSYGRCPCPNCHNGVHYNNEVASTTQDSLVVKKGNYVVMGHLNTGIRAVERSTQPRRLLQEPTALGSLGGADMVPIDDVQEQGYHSDPRQGFFSPPGLGGGYNPMLASQQPAYLQSHPGRRSSHSVAPNSAGGEGTPVFDSNSRQDTIPVSDHASVQYADDGEDTPALSFDTFSVQYSVEGGYTSIPPLGSFTAQNPVGGGPKPFSASNGPIVPNTTAGGPVSSFPLKSPEPGSSLTSSSYTSTLKYTASQGHATASQRHALAVSSNHPSAQQAAGNKNASSVHSMGNSTGQKPNGKCKPAICPRAPQPKKVATTQDAHTVKSKHEARSRTSTARSSQSSMAASNAVNQDQRKRKASAVTAAQASQQLQAVTSHDDPGQSSTAAGEEVQQSVMPDEEKKNIMKMEALGPRKNDAFGAWMQPGLFAE